jgi:hypothetical protein
MKGNFGTAEELPRAGYCNPPKDTRFKKGQSPNPSGRPKGSTRRSAIEKLLQKQFTVVEGGRRRKVSIEEAICTQTIKAAIAGDMRMRRDLLRLLEKVSKKKQPTANSQTSGPPQILLMKQSTALLLALGICVEIEGRCALSSWVVQAARERQGWAPLSPEDEKLLSDFGEPGAARPV